MEGRRRTPFPPAPRPQRARGRGKRGSDQFALLCLIHPRGKLVGVSEPYIGISATKPRKKSLRQECASGAETSELLQNQHRASFLCVLCVFVAVFLPC